MANLGRDLCLWTGEPLAAVLTRRQERDFIASVADEGQRGQTSHQKIAQRGEAASCLDFVFPAQILPISATPPGFVRFPGMSPRLAKPANCVLGHSSSSRVMASLQVGSGRLAAGPWLPLAFVERGAFCSRTVVPWVRHQNRAASVCPVCEGQLN